MNYGLQLKAQNGGRAGIFWQRDNQKKSDRKFGYKTRDQRFKIRADPQEDARNVNQFENVLGHPIENEEEKPKKPEKDFIKKNREIVNKGKKQPEKKTAVKASDPKTVTITQDQLNAILASMSKVAGGKEDNLRISIDEKHNEILIDSPRRNKSDDERDGDYRYDTDDEKRHKNKNKKDYETKPKQKERKSKKNEDISIYDLMNGNDRATKQTNRHEDDKKDRKKKSSYNDDIVEHERRNSRERKRSRDKHQSRHDRDYSEDRSYDRERRRSRDRERSKGRHRYRRDSEEREYYGSKSRERDDSSDRHRHRHRSHSRDRNHHRHRTHSRDRHRSPSPSRDRHRSNSRDRDGSGDRERHRRKRREKEKERDRDEKDEDTTKTNKGDEVGDPNKAITPREVAGIPLALPWKHMTKAEQLRLLAARKKLLNDEEKTEVKEKSKERDSDKKSSRRKKRPVESREASEVSGYDDRYSDDDRHSRKDEHKTDTLPPAVPRGHMTLAEKKKEQWARERAESKINEITHTPWGRPGAGAPIRTGSGNVAADYKSRQDQIIRKSMDEDHQVITEESDYTPSKYEESKSKSKPREALAQGQLDEKWLSPQQELPAAMRSSFLFGQVGDDDLFRKKKEEEKRLWLEELNRQREEKKLRHSKDKPFDNTTNDTWADKFSNDHKPAGLPEQIAQSGGGNLDDTGRVSSAPTQVEERSLIRGQNVILDPVTLKEMDEKRRRHLEHQQAVMEQVQEKQRQKQMERERKLREDMEEEAKLQKERDKVQQQLDSEQQKARQREVKRQQEVERLKEAMDEAHEQALREKYTKRMQHLEEGGHDVHLLKAALQAKLTPRLPPATHIEPTYIPGLNLDNTSPRVTEAVPTLNDREVPWQYQPYIENRTLTPSQYRHQSKGQYSDPLSPKREFGTQTGMGNRTNDDEFGVNQVEMNTQRVTNREATDVGILYKPGKKVRVKSAPREEESSRTPGPKPPQEKKKSKKERDLWNYQNKKHKRPVKQSEKDPFYKQKKKESEVRKVRREQELLALVEMNKPLIPTERFTPTHSRDPSPGGHTPRGMERQINTRRSKSHSPSNVLADYGYEKYERTPRRNRSPASHRSASPPIPVQRGKEIVNRQSSPPVPALRHKMDKPADYNGSTQNLSDPTILSNRLMADRQIVKYADIDPLEIPVGGGEFVPFTRTIEILDPADAGSPLPVSREATKILNARKEYLKGLKPGDYGKRVDMYEDRVRMSGEQPTKKDPIFNPSLVKDHPTDRQSMILQQLSSLKENLIQRQRELETFSPTDLE